MQPVQVYRSMSRFSTARRNQVESAAGGEEERDHSSEENDRDEKQDKALHAKRLVRAIEKFES